MTSKPENQSSHGARKRAAPRSAPKPAPTPLADVFGASSGVSGEALAAGGSAAASGGSDEDALAALFARRPDPAPTRPVAEGDWWAEVTGKPVAGGVGGVGGVGGAGAGAGSAATAEDHAGEVDAEASAARTDATTQVGVAGDSSAAEAPPRVRRSPGRKTGAVDSAVGDSVGVGAAAGGAGAGGAARVAGVGGVAGVAGAGGAGAGGVAGAASADRVGAAAGAAGASSSVGAAFGEDAELDALFAAAGSDAAPDLGEAEPGALPAGIPVASSRRKRVGARLFGSRARAFTSTLVAVLVIALVAGGAYVGVRAYTDQRELTEAQALLESAQADATDADGLATDAQAELAASVASGGKTVEEVSPALDAVDGAAPADQLAAARAALAALQALLAPAVAAPPTPYETVAEAQDIGAVRSAEQRAREHAATVSLATVDVREADTAIKTARGSLFTALLALGAALPATADGLLSENPLAESQFRDAVTAAALQVGVAQKAGGTGAAELIAYGQAVAALRESQTTKAEEQARASRRSSGGSGGTTSPSPSPTPTPQPSTPAPDPVPVPVPDPSPSPSP